VLRGSYEKAVEKVCKKYSFERSELSMQTALIRNKVGKIEAHLLSVILRRSALRQSVTCGEGLVLANSMIEGTETQVRLMDWKKNNLKNRPNDNTCWNAWPALLAKKLAEERRHHHLEKGPQV
jgi:hypothetical protein